MIKVLKDVRVYGPEDLGIKTLVIAGDKISHIVEGPVSLSLDHEVIEGRGKLVIPGLIDGHVHVLGGGGEGSYRTRTPELMLSDMIEGGVTTVVGCLGTDGVSRNMTSLVAKLKGLKEEGVSAYGWIGSYRLPLTTVTGDIQKDMLMVEELIGVGEIAMNDHRAGGSDLQAYRQAIADARVGGMLSGKAGKANLHLGDGKTNLKLIYDLLESSDLPISQFIPTHMNRNPQLFEEGLAYGKKGGYLDFTTSTTSKFIEEGELPASRAYVKGIAAGVPKENMTFTSDGQGSLPAYDDKGNFKGLTLGKVSSLFTSFKELVEVEGLGLSEALLPVTKNPAKILGLQNKGHLAPGADADLVLLSEETLALEGVIARGQWMMKNGTMVKKGTFE